MIDQLGIEQAEHQDASTEPTTKTTVLRMASKKLGLASEEDVVVESDERAALRSVEIPALKAVPDRQQEWRLSYQDGEDQRRQDQQPADLMVGHAPRHRRRCKWRRTSRSAFPRSPLNFLHRNAPYRPEM